MADTIFQGTIPPLKAIDNGDGTYSIAWRHQVSGLTSGKKTVAVAGTSERLVAASTPCKYVVLTALAANTGRVVYGDSNVDETPGTIKGIPLYVLSGIPQTHVIPCNDAYNIYLDVAVNAEGVSYNLLT